MEKENVNKFDLELGPSVILEQVGGGSHLKVQIIPTVEIRCETQTEEEIHEQVQAELKAKQIAMTKFPAWVVLSYVRKIRDLDCFESVREMMITGVPLIEIARQVQMMGELPGIKVDTLRMYLEHYKATIPTWMMAARQQPKQYLELKQKADEGIDCLKEMQRLYNWIKERIEIGMNQERKFALLTSGMDRNFIVASQILQQIDEMKSKLGISDDQARVGLPKHMSDQVEWSRIYSRESVQVVMNSPEKRSRVVQAAERLLDMYATKLSSEQIDKIKAAREVQEVPPDIQVEP